MSPQSYPAADVLQDELAPGEHLVWSGGIGPTYYRVYRKRMRQVLLLPILIVAAATLFILALATALVLGQPGQTSHQAVSLLLPVYFIVLCAILIVIIFLAIMSLIIMRFNGPDRQTVYAITNRRVLIITPASPRTVVSLTKGQMNVIRRIEQPDGTGSLYFGVGAGAPAFLGVARVREVEQLIRDNVGSSLV